MTAENWPRITFAELIDHGLLQVGDGYRAKNSELGGEGMIFLRAGHVSDTSIDLTSADRFHSEIEGKLEGKVAQAGDVMITTKGNSTGRVSFVTPDLPPFVYSPHLSFWRSLRPKDLAPGFLRAWSKSVEFRQQLYAFAHSTDMAPYLSLADQKRLRITLPPVEIQQSVAKVLGALDDKIELNRKMNATLDELARTIFRSWFVDFDPVRAKMEGRDPFGMDAETAALFPDRLVDSSMGPIPEGWDPTTLDQLVDFNPRRSLARGTETTFLEMKNVATSGHRPLGLERREVKGGARFSNGDTLLARITPCLENGKTAFVDFLEDDEIGFGSTEYIVMRAKEPLPHIWSYLLARHEPFRKFAIQNMTGTSGRQRVSADSLRSFPTVVPDIQTANAFAQQCQPYFELIKANDEESQTLAELRDTLLPELISGRIRVPEAERLVGEAI